MKQKTLYKFLESFGFASLIHSPERIYGGLFHTMWRISTKQGSYVIKQLSSDIDLKNEKVINNYEWTEEIAFRFKNLTIPAIHALKKNGKYLHIIDGTGFLVYPWVSSKTLDLNVISPLHAIKISKLLAKMHLIHLVIDEIKEAEFDFHSSEKILHLIEKAKHYHCPFVKDLEHSQEVLLSLNEQYQKAIPNLKNQTIISHGDLDQKNVLWDEKDNPLLIDWESARRLNPTYEIVNASLDWSGITTQFDQNLFSQMMESYQQAGGVIEPSILRAAFSNVAGNWINWLVYNIERSCSFSESENKKLGIEQVRQVILTLLQLKNIR